VEEAAAKMEVEAWVPAISQSWARHKGGRTHRMLISRLISHTVQVAGRHGGSSMAWWARLRVIRKEPGCGWQLRLWSSPGTPQTRHGGR